MRDLNDIVMIRFDLSGSVEMDMERVEEDPAWSMVEMKYDVRNPDQRKLALEEYLRNYLQRETILEMNPATSGPATIYGVNATTVASSLSETNT
jgi:hypothetical protein